MSLDDHNETQAFSNVTIANIRQVMKEAEMNLKVLVEVENDTFDSLLPELQLQLLRKLKYPILQLTANDNGDGNYNHEHVKETTTENSSDAIKTNINTDGDSHIGLRENLDLECITGVDCNGIEFIRNV